MYIREVRSVDSKKSKVKFDNGISIILYKGEIRKYNIKEETCIDIHDYDYIMNELLPKRCRERAMYIIERTDKTRKQLSDKLRQNGYTDDIIEHTLEFLDRYGYIDDLRYAKNYINSKHKSRSRRQIEYELLQRGIDSEKLKEVFDEGCIDELGTVKKLLIKRRYSEDDSDNKPKHIRYLMRKGFSYDTILKAMDELKYIK